MHLRHLLAVLLLVCLPTALLAELANGDLPAARWYAHIDLVAMRNGAAGKQLYTWLENEVFDDLREEIGFDASKEADVITALATPAGGIMVVVDGAFSQTTKDRIVALGAMGSDFNTLEFDGNAYYFFGGDDKSGEHDPGSLQGGAYLSLALNKKLLVTSTEEQMQQLIKSKGRIPGDYNSGSLIVLSAQQSLVQAGMSAEGFGADLGWDSNVLRNTKQIALLVAEAAGKIAIEGQLITTEASVASSLASIVRGLISLQVFNDDIDPRLVDLLQSTTVNVDGATLVVKLAVDPAMVIEAID
jgi:hypothetical protein